MLNALTSDPEVWSKTALLITYDENDGFFDHVVGPYPNVGGLAGQSTVPLDNELFDGNGRDAGRLQRRRRPVRPRRARAAAVVSPWSTGGWVCSEVFDHTSLIRFIEARFGVDEPNITPWRRAVCGDLTSAFDFESARDHVPPLPSVAAYKPTGTTSRPGLPPDAPGVGSVPKQEPGCGRRAGSATGSTSVSTPRRAAQARVRNRGKLGVGIQARSLTVAGAPYSYTIGAGHELDATLPNPGTYDLSLHGPNGFFRHFAGSPETVLSVEVDDDHGGGRLTLRIAQPATWRRPRPPAGRRQGRRRLRT